MRPSETHTSDATGLAGIVFHPGYRIAAVLDPDGTIRDVPDADRIANWRPEAFVGRNIKTVSVEASEDGVGVGWTERLRIAGQTKRTARYVDPRPGASDGEPPSVDTVVTPVVDPSGAVSTILLQAQDLSDSLRVRRQLEDSEERFRGLTEALPQMIWIANPQRAIEYVSPRWVSFSGKSPQALLGYGLFELIHPDDLGVTMTDHEPGVDHSTAVFRLRRHDGEYRWMEAQIQSIRDSSGAITRWVGGTIDITDRLEADRVFREHDEQLRVALSVTGMGRFAVYLRDQRMTGDDQLVNILGVDFGILMERGGLDAFLEMIHPDDALRVRRAVDVAIEHGPNLDVEYRWMRPGTNGPEQRWLVSRARVEFDDEGAVRMLGVVEDITDRHQAEQSRLLSQKREAIGTLAGGIAHDFNNVISAILSNASLAQAELDAGASPRTSIAEIARGANRAAYVVKRMLGFSREEAPTRVLFELGEVVEEACTLVRPTLQHGVTLQATVAKDLPPALGDSNQLHQVVMNLVTNAGHAIGTNQGRIDVAVDAVTVPSPLPTPELASSQYLRLRVTDDGAGIPESTMARIFDPFFTTKPAGEGTGLGLAAAQTIARNHGGTIDVKSVLGKGTTFTVLIAVGTNAPSARPAFTPQSGAKPRVMFVDDEPALTRLADRALQYLGCETTAFTNAGDALAAFKAAPQEYDVLVTDQTMPTMSGLELIELVHAIRADLPVVLSSGFLTEADRRHASRCRVDAIVPKPCSIDELAAAVMKVVAPLQG